MVIISKNERDMNEKEKFRFDLMKALAVLFKKVNLLDPNIQLDLTDDSLTAVKADMLIKWLDDYKLKNRKEIFLPESAKIYPGKQGFESLFSQLDKIKSENRGQILNSNRNKLISLTLLDNFKEEVDSTVDSKVEVEEDLDVIGEGNDSEIEQQETEGEKKEGPEGQVQKDKNRKSKGKKHNKN